LKESHPQFIRIEIFEEDLVEAMVKFIHSQKINRSYQNIQGPDTEVIVKLNRDNKRIPRRLRQG
jgi:hypothetical protein